MRNKRRLRWGIAAVTIAALLFGFLQRRWWTLNDITTGQTPEYPDLPAHVYAVAPEAAHTAAETACATIPRWRVVPPLAAQDSVAPPIQVEVKTALFNFTDDLTVRFESAEAPAGSGASVCTRVVIRSHSRVGKGDLGENERHIRALQRRMDDRLPRVFPPPP